MWNDRKLRNVFAFLQEHQQWSIEFQRNEWQSMLGGASSRQERLSALLYRIANTQSKPKLDDLVKFWEMLHKSYTSESKPSIASFCALLNVNTGRPFTDLYTGLLAQKGWGQKTAALFVKNVISIHKSDVRSLHFFHDARKLVQRIDDNERIYLPVDAVIERIFYQDGAKPHNPFRRINDVLQEMTKRDPLQMLIWDDLWFWGFMTQKASDGGRSMEWNAPKFWAMRSHSKDDVLEIEKLANQFIKLVQV